MKCSKKWNGCPLKNGYEEMSGELPYYGEGLFGCGYYDSETKECSHENRDNFQKEGKK